MIVSSTFKRDGVFNMNFTMDGEFVEGDQVRVYASQARNSLMIARDGAAWDWAGPHWEPVRARGGVARTVWRPDVSNGSRPTLRLVTSQLPAWARPAGLFPLRAVTVAAKGEGWAEVDVDWPTAVAELETLRPVIERMRRGEPAKPAAAVDDCALPLVDWRGRVREAVAKVNELMATAEMDDVLLSLEGGRLVAKVRVVQEVEL